MIINMYYNKGNETSHFLSNLFGTKYVTGDGEHTTPHWCVHWRFERPDVEAERDIMNSWLHENCTGSYDSCYRFNSGSPYLEINIYNQDDLTTFRLRWESRNEGN